MFHTIDLGNGVVTPGVDKSAEKLERLEFPADLSGKTVLDVGAFDGFFSFEAERRNAARVLATDWHSWSNSPESPGTKATFNLARQALRSQVEDQDVDVLGITPESVGRFDVVLFLGVLYHLRDPLLALERMAEVTRELLILETLVDMTHTRRAAAAFYPGNEHINDPSNWWGPNPAAVIGMLKVVGFSRIEVIGRRSLVGRMGSVAYNLGNVAHSRLARSRTSLPLNYVSRDRMVVHAYKDHPSSARS